MRYLRLAPVLAPFMLVSPVGAQQTFTSYMNSLPVATSVGSGDQFYVRQGGISKQVTAPFTLPGMSIVVNPYTPEPTITGGNQPFQITETVTGTCTTGASPCHDNFINISSDNAVVGSGISGAFTSGNAFHVNHNIGGAAMTGNRAAGTYNILMNATTGNTAAGVSYSALTALANASANDNGTDTTQSNSRGQLEAMNIFAHLASGATDWNAVQGVEIDVKMETGSSAYEKEGAAIVQLNGDAVAGASVDAALVISNGAAVGSGTVGWTNGILFGGAQGFWPFTSSSVIVTCTSPCGSATSFIDMSNATFSTSFLKGPSFNVSGVGVITSGKNGGTAGELILQGSTSSSGTISAGSAGRLLFANTTTDLSMSFNDGGNGTMFTMQGTTGTIAASLEAVAATTGVAPQLAAIGTDTAININLVPKGTGVLAVNGTLGVTCSGSPTASFATVGGLVTHC